MYSYHAPVLPVVPRGTSSVARSGPTAPGSPVWEDDGNMGENRTVREQSIAILFHADTVTYPAW